MSEYEAMRATLDKSKVKYLTGVGGWQGGDQVIEIGNACFHFWDGAMTVVLMDFGQRDSFRLVRDPAISMLQEAARGKLVV